MLEDQVRKDITGLGEIRRPIKFSARLDHLGDDLSTDSLAGQVTLVVGDPRIPCHMPAAKTFAERNLMAHLVVAECHEFAPVGTGNHRPSREPGNAPSLGDRVTIHAEPSSSFEHRFCVVFRSVEDMEDSSELGIERNDFDTSAGNIPDVDVLVEIHSPGIAPRDSPRLKAGPGENQQLGTGWNVEMFQHAGDECL